MPSEPSYPSVEELEDQERRLRLRRFDEDDAWELGRRLVELARSRDLPVTVDVRRATHQLFRAALRGSVPDHDSWIRRKGAVVERFARSSMLVGQRAREAGTTIEEMYALDTRDYAAHGGAFPLVVEGVGLVGVVTVSGLPQVEDHRLVVEALESFVAGQ